MFDIENKEDSPEKLAAVAGKPTKNILFAQEFNAVVDEVKRLENDKANSTSVYTEKEVDTLLELHQKTITGNTIIDNSYNNCLIKVKGIANITIPPKLVAGFNCVFDVFPGVNGSLIAGAGVTFSSPNGASFVAEDEFHIYKDGPSETFRIKGI